MKVSLTKTQKFTSRLLGFHWFRRGKKKVLIKEKKRKKILRKEWQSNAEEFLGWQFPRDSLSLAFYFANEISLFNDKIILSVSVSGSRSSHARHSLGSISHTINNNNSVMSGKYSFACSTNRHLVIAKDFVLNSWTNWFTDHLFGQTAKESNELHWVNYLDLW